MVEIINSVVPVIMERWSILLFLVFVIVGITLLLSVLFDHIKPIKKAQ